ncbi:GNAT family acetyltransferase [Vibrio sp. UCD-FRSSP16_10]|uniref:GNAT family N-acetyltransferase n=1 Tax=unclassified Vibrio TaxID=2614977 RepID=UPI0007FF1C46|nr:MULTISPECIES: GNAT family N-acetyltransferase [unclassified Vibrio]OBT13407.1 GNAT family acetyltransferase [Vibrio sp. UCD-FRSSP16_10]OBT17917.1 GNAT family acetyltransferase [Vibrio sp. UCD-FRSSP16_30]
MQVKIVDWNSRDDIFFVRHCVFSLEQGIDTSLDFDGQDLEAVHAVVYAQNQPVATGRMLQDGHIGRVAVLDSYRGKGLGATTVNALVQQAKKQQFAKVYLGAQLHALDFYYKLGFSPFGERYFEAGIEHQSMQLVL